MKTRQWMGLLLLPLMLIGLLGGCFGDPENKAQVKVINSTSAATINGIYIKAASIDDWGLNRLFGGQVLPGDNWYSGFFYEPGLYDMKATFSTGQPPEEQQGIRFEKGQTIKWTFTDQQNQDYASLTLDNQSAIAINELYWKVIGTTAWSVNQLASPVQAGGSYTISNIPVGTYDLKAVMAGGEEKLQEGIAFTKDQTVTWTFQSQQTQTASLTVDNGTASLTLSEIYISLDSSGAWGDNWLTNGETIGPGTTKTFTGIDAGTYDLKAVTTDSQEVTEDDMVFAAGQSYTWLINPGRMLTEAGVETLAKGMITVRPNMVVIGRIEYSANLVTIVK